MFYRGY